MTVVNTALGMPRYFVIMSSVKEGKSLRDWELVNKWDRLFDALFQGQNARSCYSVVCAECPETQ